jgi:hypothetical protein
MILDTPLTDSFKAADLGLPSAKDELIVKTEVVPPPSPPSPPPPPTGVINPDLSEKLSTLGAPVAAPVTDDEEIPAKSTKPAESGITALARPSLEALKKFLAAPTWRERLHWVQKPDTVKPLMEKHYRSHPDGPINVTNIDFIERNPAKGGAPAYCMFEVRGGSLKRGVLVLVEEKTRNDFRVDWEAFVEFKDQLLWEFLIKPGTPPGKFRVMMRRKHCFDKNVPDLDRKDAFEISQPGADTTANVFVVKGGTVAKSLARQLDWGDTVAVTVQLVWRGEGGKTWVELKAVPTFGWRG